jgi:hypothetical protein
VMEYWGGCMGRQVNGYNDGDKGEK